MNAIQRRIDELHQYNPPQTAPNDLDDFWRKTLETARARPFHDTRVKATSPARHMNIDKVTFEGYDDTPIHGWFITPGFEDRRKRPCIVLYHGYTGGKGLAEQYAPWLLMGMAVFAVDVRGQGGETGNRLRQEEGMTRGWMNQGITDRERCYYKAIAVDAVRAADWAAAQPEVDAEKIVVAGASQGGGLALIVGALSRVPRLIAADIPNMCHMDFGILQSTGSLTEAAEYVSRFPDQLERVLETLSYFDLLNLAERIAVPVLVSVSLKDTVCLPETVFAAYNRISSEKELKIYPFNGHSVGEGHLKLVMEYIAGKFKL